MQNRSSITGMALALMMGMISCATSVPNTTESDDVAPSGSIVEVANATLEFATFSKLVHQEGLVPVLSGDGPFTVFAPTNDAFAAISDETMDALNNTPAALTQVLTYHVVAGDLNAATLAEQSNLVTLQGTTLQIESDGVQIWVNGVLITHADIGGDNGVIHGIEAVLIPEDLEIPVLFPTVDEQTDMEPSEGTDMEPSEGTDMEPSDGETPETTIRDNETDGNQTGETDGNQTDDPDDIPEPTTGTDPPGNTQPDPDTMLEGMNIVEIASAQEDLEILTQAIGVAGLVDTLTGEGPFTVFAPTDDAFAALPDGVLNALLDDPNALGETLAYHVVAGDLTAAEVSLVGSLTTLIGEDLAIGIFGDTIIVNNAIVQITDIEATNGIIHVIDAVLIPPQPGNLIEVASAAGGFDTLLTALDVTGLTSSFTGPGPFTVFAPTDAAFAALPDGVLAGLLADSASLSNVLTYHVVAGGLLASDIVTQDTLTTLQGADVEINTFGDSWMINDSMVTSFDIKASNGVIHVIDAVLLPPPPKTLIDVAEEAGQFETLLAAIDAAGLTHTLDDLEQSFTVLAPTDAAFAALPEGALDALLADPDALGDLLLYHVVGGAQSSDEIASSSLIATLNGNEIRISIEGGDVYVNTAKITIVDIETANGIIHVIDAVLSLPHTISNRIVSEPGTFSTLTTAVSVAGLFETLNGEGPFTLFAPTNDAFAALPKATLEAALGNPAALSNILLFHVVPGKVTAADVASAGSLTTAQGGELEVSVNGGAVQIGGATITMIDIPCTNGVIHVIDAVLLPPTGD